jgi:hypothetical protein
MQETRTRALVKMVKRIVQALVDSNHDFFDLVERHGITGAVIKLGEGFTTASTSVVRSTLVALPDRTD